MPLVFVVLGSAAASLALDRSEAAVEARSSPCQAAVIRFLEAPTGPNFSAAQRGEGKCWSNLGTEHLQALDRLIEQGNKYAARLLAPYVRQLGGGELEDALRALGQFARRDMHDFVKISDSDAITAREFTSALTMLPLDLTDNLDGQLTEMRARRSALDGVTDAGRPERKSAAIAAIDDFIAEIERAKSAAGSQNH